MARALKLCNLTTSIIIVTEMEFKFAYTIPA